MKLNRFVRDMPKYERSQKWLDDSTSAFDEDGNPIKKDTLENIAFKEGNEILDREAMYNYEPAMYKIVNDPLEAKTETLSQAELHKDFLFRTERILRQHRERSTIHDGLSALTSQDVISRITESPTKLKKKAKGFLKLLQKHEVYLNDDGDVQWDKVEDRRVLKTLQQREELCRLTLMQADLEFEYPQKLEKMLVKSDILKWLDDEEERLRNLELEEAFNQMAKSKGAQRMIPGNEFIITVDDYYGNVEKTNGINEDQMYFRKKKKEKISFERWFAANRQDSIFDEDLLEQQYKFWETEDERSLRLKKMWIEMRRKNALGGVDAIQPAEHIEMTKKITELLRGIRWRIDQELTRKNMEPIFKHLYYTYEKEEFLLDVDLEFHKVKKLLEKNPRVLRDDPIMSIEYLKIIEMIKQKKLLEVTSDHYDPESAPATIYHDINALERKEKLDQKSKLLQFERQLQFED